MFTQIKTKQNKKWSLGWYKFIFVQLSLFVSEQVIIQLALAVKLISLRTEIWLFQNPRTNDFKLMR